jgi:hypothetical protein
VLVNFERKVCYLAHPKTASQTTALTLREKSGFVPVTDHHHAWDATYPGRDLEEMGIDVEAARRWWFSDHRSFVYLFVIRNPWDTIASWYELSKAHIRHDRIGPEWFEAWKALNPGVFPEKDLWPFLYREPPGPTAVIRYGELHTTFNRLAGMFRFPRPGVLPMIGMTKGRRTDYRSYYDSESRKWVERTFPNAIEAGSYTFE